MSIFIARIDTSTAQVIKPAVSVAPGVLPIDAAVSLGWNEPGEFVPEHIDPDTGEFIPDHTEPPVYNGMWREINDTEKSVLMAPTPEELRTQFDQAVTDYLNVFATTPYSDTEQPFDNMEVARLAEFTEAYEIQGRIANLYYNEIWQAAEALVPQVMGGTLLIEDAISQLPVPTWDREIDPSTITCPDFMEVVQELPTEGNPEKLYAVPYDANNAKLYGYFKGVWVLIGDHTGGGGTGSGPVARKPELFKYGGDAETGYTPINSSVITVSNSILFIDYILILNGTTGLLYLQDNGTDYSVSENVVTINNPTLSDGMKIKIAYYS